MSPHDLAQVRGCYACRDGRDPCNPMDPLCMISQETDLVNSKLLQAEQARETKDQEPFVGIPVYDAHERRYARIPGDRALYLSPAEEEAIRVAERHMRPEEAFESQIRLRAIELAAIENTLAAERMGLATNEEALDALAQAGDCLPLPNALDRQAATNDMVNLPAHYARFKIEPIRFIVENGLNWFQGNIVKYASRAEHKHATPVEDISKIIRYGEMWREYASGNPDWWRAP